MLLGQYLALLTQSEHALADALRAVAEVRETEPTIARLCTNLARDAERHAALVDAWTERYEVSGNGRVEYPSTWFTDGRMGSAALLRDLHDLYLMATEVDLVYTLIEQAARALQDAELLSTLGECQPQTQQLQAWLLGRMKEAAPQALVD